MLGIEAATRCIAASVIRARDPVCCTERLVSCHVFARSCIRAVVIHLLPHEVRMKTTQGTMLQSLRAVQVFLDQNAERLAGVVKSGTRQKLDDAIAELSGHVSTQTGSHLAAQGATQKH